MSTTAKPAPTTIEELAERYVQAWNDHDLEAVLSLLTPDCKIVIHGGGGPIEATGTDEIRKTFEYILRAWPDQTMKATKLRIGDGFYVGENVVSATLSEPWSVGATTVQPRGQKVEFELLETMVVEDLLIKEESTWIDGLAIRNQLESQRE